MNRRDFLIGLFGAAAVAAASPIPKAIEALPEPEFKAAAIAALPRNDEIYGDSNGNYGFAKIEFLDKSPWFKVTIPEGFRPLREESDKIAVEAIARMKRNV